MKKTLLFAAALMMSATTLFASAPESMPTAPTVPANQVKAVYSAVYSADCGFGDWGSGTTYAQEDYGKKFTTTNLGYFGLVDFALNCTKMEKLHLDVWFEEAGSFRVVPIHGGAEKGVTVTVAEGEVNSWKSVDLALNEGDFANVTDWTNVYQIKIDNVANKTFWLNNIYFYTSQAPQEDDEAPTKPEISEPAAALFSVSAKFTSTDNSGAVIFKAYDEAKENVLATVNAVSGVPTLATIGNLTANTDYTFYVQAEDESGNKSEFLEVKAKTNSLDAPEAPVMEADKVLSILSGVYEPAIPFGVGGWGQSTQTASGKIGETPAMECTNSNYLGWEFQGELDASHATKIHMDVYNYADNAATSIQFTPVWKDAAGTGHELAKAITIVDGWNAIEIDLADYADINKARIFQLKWDGMPKHIVIANVYFYGDQDKPDPTPVPELTAPQVPTVDAANVKAIMCETYENNLGYWPQGWGGCGWVDTCKAGVNFKYAKTMAWDCFASDWQGAGVADYANLHFDIWFAEDGINPVVKMEFNGTDPTAEITIPGEYKAGWNSVNVNVVETFGEQPMDDLKCLTVKVTKEGGPVAWANILFFNGDYTSTEATGTCGDKPVWPEDAPATAPAAPTVDGASILGAELTTDYAFEPLDWPGAMPQLLTFETGETIYYMSKMTWQIYTSWAEDYYDVSEYDMLHVDLYPATGTEIKITIEGLKIDDGGQGYKNSKVKTLTAGAWNALDIALSEFPAMESGDPYDFSDIRYFILEGYNAEQSALTVGNVYFYKDETALKNVKNVKAVRKMMNKDGIVIERNGVRYNVVGAIVK